MDLFVTKTQRPTFACHLAKTLHIFRHDASVHSVQSVLQCVLTEVCNLRHSIGTFEQTVASEAQTGSSVVRLHVARESQRVIVVENPMWKPPRVVQCVFMQEALYWSALTNGSVDLTSMLLSREWPSVAWEIFRSQGWMREKLWQLTCRQPWNWLPAQRERLRQNQSHSPNPPWNLLLWPNKERLMRQMTESQTLWYREIRANYITFTPSRAYRFSYWIDHFLSVCHSHSQTLLICDFLSPSLSSKLMNVPTLICLIGVVKMAV